VYPNLILQITVSILLGAWLVSRPSEWLAIGVGNIGKYLNLSEYAIGVLASLTAITGEITVVVFSFLLAYMTNQAIYIELAILATLYSISFNFITLGLLVFVKGKKIINVPEEVLSKELEIIDWTFIATMLIALLWMVNVLFVGSGASNQTLYLPREAAFLLPLGYLIYIANLRRIHYVGGTSYIAEPRLSPLQSMFFTIISVMFIVAGGKLLTDTASILLVGKTSILAHYGDPLILTALILGGSSAIYDVIINLIFVSKGQVLASVGNLIGSVIQLIMLVIGIVGIFLPIPITQYVAFELAVIGLSLYFYRQAIADQGLDRYEGAMLFLLQLFSIALGARGFV